MADMEVYEIIWICDPDNAHSAKPEPAPGWNVEFLCPSEALAFLPGGDCDAVVLDCPLPDGPALTY